MIIDPATISEDAAYHWQIGTIVPRPIAWTSTRNEDGSTNLAPFSFFTGVCSDPPLCLICVSKRERDGRDVDKDTRRNIERTGAYVIHIVPDALAAAMNLTSGEYAYGVDELALTGLTQAPAQKVDVARIVEAPVAMECRLHQLVDVGRSGTAIIIGEILLWHIDDRVISNGRVDFGKLDAVGRLGGAAYTRTRDRFEMKRPRV